MMESLQQKVESWIRDGRMKIFKVTWPPQWQWPMVVRWPWTQGREQRKRIQEEVVRRKKQLQELCFALKAESVSDLQEILCCMVLSECVYKRPASDLVRSANIFKADFGGQLISLERVQPSADHVPHRYLLAEAGDTLFASFVGTKQYKDVMADANIFQGAIFHEDKTEDTQGPEFSEGISQSTNGENNTKEPIYRLPKSGPKPAAHRGFMARAKGIPALELYRLAQKKKRKLVLCGHSLGGAVAALATLAILRVVAASSKEHERVQVKCITFSQPPVGNAALRDYVNIRGWKNYFKTYCIPEDLVPRILSPAYFHHYNSSDSVQSPGSGTSIPASKTDERFENQKSEKRKDNGGENLVLGLGPVQSSFWRLSRLVPLESVRKQFFSYGGNKLDPVENSIAVDSSATASIDSIVGSPQSLEIQEDSDGISLRPLPETDDETTTEVQTRKSWGKSATNNGNQRAWQKIPTLPSYVPFGELYLLGSSSVEALSSSEYSKLTSVRSVIAEVKERFQSHSMRSYRSRFLRIYELCMNDNGPSFFGLEQIQQFPHLQKWLGVSTADTIRLGQIVETPVVHAATSIVPLGWNGVRGKNADTLKVDISGHGLHLCTTIRARVGGKWCSTMVESFPSPPSFAQNHGLQPEIQKMRIIVGPPLRNAPKCQMEETIMPMFPSLASTSTSLQLNQNVSTFDDGKFVCPDDLHDFMILCTTDFSTVSKPVYTRTRRVKLVGLEGAGKTSLLRAILEQERTTSRISGDDLRLDVDVQEGIAGGLCYSDSAAVNLQNLTWEASHFRDELWKGIRNLSKKTDLVVLVHNLSHRVPRYRHPDSSSEQPALTLLLDEAKSLGIPWVLGITNKFSVSAHQQRAAIDVVLKAYQASPSTSSVINSCPYITSTGASVSWESDDKNSNKKEGSKNLFFAPINFSWRPFEKKPAILPVEGVAAFCQLIHEVLRKHEEAAFQELAQDRLFVELARARAYLNQDAQAKASSLTSAAVGASIGAGLGIVLAVVMGAGSALRKP